MADDPIAQLYQAPPAQFMELRGKLADAARRSGDPAGAKEIAAQRKPSTAAWVVNLLVHTDPGMRERMTDLGDRLRDAQANLDAELLRELSAERRTLVDELARQAFAEAGVSDPAAALRDDVTSTLQAAIADPDVAERLGYLQRAEHWSGFGDVVMPAPPKLRVVHGGKSTKPVKQERAAPPEHDVLAEAKEQLHTAAATLAAAEQAKTDADDELDERQAEFSAARMKRDEARRRLEDAEHRLDAAEQAYAAAQQVSAEVDELLKAARRRQRESREALDRARKSR